MLWQRLKLIKKTKKKKDFSMIQCQNQSQVLRHVLKIKFLSSDYFLHHDTALASDTMTWALYSIICKFKYWSFLTSWHSHLYISVCAISVCSKSKLLYMYDSTQTYIYTIQFKHIYIYGGYPYNTNKSIIQFSIIRS